MIVTWIEMEKGNETIPDMLCNNVRKVQIERKREVNVPLNPLSAHFTKWPNTLNQFVGNCLSTFDYFVGLVLKGLTNLLLLSQLYSKCVKLRKHTSAKSN